MSEEKLSGKKLPHSLILNDRKNVSVGGVLDVGSFDEQVIVLYTDVGELTVKGKNLHINKLSVDTGEMQIEGKIDCLTYSDSGFKSKGGIFSKLFK